MQSRSRTVPIVAIVVLSAVIIAGAFVSVRGLMGMDGDASPTGSAHASASSAATTTVPTPSASAAATPVPTTPVSPTPDPTAAAVDDELVMTFAAWSDIVTPSTTSLVADGRLTTLHLHAEHDGPALVQRRLSDRGIQLVRDEIAATGLFDESAFHQPVPRPGEELPGRGASGYTVELRTATGVVRVSWVSVAPDEAEWAEPSPERERLDALGARLESMDEWLPVEAWSDPDPTPFVPERYRLFTVGQPWGGDAAELPPDVAEVAWPLDGTLLDFGEPLADSTADHAVRCAVLGHTDAEQVSSAVAAAGAPMGAEPGARVAVAASLGHRAEMRIIDLILVGLHPHEDSCAEARPPAFF